MAKKRPKKESRARADTAATGAKGEPKAAAEAKGGPAATRANTRPRKRGGDPKPKRLGLLDAASQILAEAKQPMACKAIVEQVVAQKLWSSKGKTPAATLHAGLIREIAKKGKDARFRKVGRGRFALNAQRVC